MTSTGPSSPPGGSDAESAYADRVFRSGASVFWGCAILVVLGWLTIDAMLKSPAPTVWKVLAGLVFAVPLVVAFTLRPAVYASADRIRIRNPFRTVVLPWGSVDAVRTGYSSEVLANGAKYQLWAVPVSIRQRKKALRRRNNAAAAGDPDASRKSLGRPTRGSGDDRQLAGSDQIVRDLQALAETAAERPTAQGSPSVRWAYELIVPCVVGLVALIVLLAV